MSLIFYIFNKSQVGNKNMNELNLTLIENYQI